MPSISELVNAVNSRRLAAKKEADAKEFQRKKEEELKRREAERLNLARSARCKEALEPTIVPLLNEINAHLLKGKGRVEIDLLPFQECGTWTSYDTPDGAPGEICWEPKHQDHPGARAKLVWSHYNNQEKPFAFGVHRKKTHFILYTEATFTSSDKISFVIGGHRTDPQDPLSWENRGEEAKSAPRKIACPDSVPSHPKILPWFREDLSLEPPLIRGGVKWCEVDPLAQIDNENFAIDFKIALAWAFLRASS